MLHRILKMVLPVLVIGLGVIGAKALIDSRPKIQPTVAERYVPAVRTLAARKQSVVLTVTAHGTVIPHAETSVVPEVAGKVIYVSPSLVAGGFFDAGDVLLRIDPRDYELAVIRARAQIAQAKLRLEQERAEAEVARKEWAELGQGAPSPLVVREPQLAEAEAAVAAAGAALQEAELKLERTAVTAPFSGRVRTENVDLGQYVAPGNPLAQIYGIAYAEVRLPLPDRDLAFLDLSLSAGRLNGPRVLLRAEFAGSVRTWTGRIVRTEGEIDPESRMVYAVARVDDPYGTARSGQPPLAVGMFVEAEIFGRRADGVYVLPRSAFRDEETIYLVDAENRLRLRRVEVLRRTTGEVIVRSGLEEGERVLLSALETPVEGMQVRMETAE